MRACIVTMEKQYAISEISIILLIFNQKSTHMVYLWCIGFPVTAFVF